MMHQPVAEAQEVTCECCGCTDEVSPIAGRWLMGLDPVPLVCKDCFLVWYDSHSIYPEEIGTRTKQLRESKKES